MRLILLSLIALASFGQSFKLYLKDGSHHVAREYQIEQDRIRYYSVERSDWEEIPAELVDLPKTESERKTIESARAQAEADAVAEDEAARALRREARAVPAEYGVYYVDGSNLRIIDQADVKVVTDKKRSLLKTITPIPIVTGKATVEVDGERSAFVVRESRPEFYIRQSNEERMAIIRLTPKKGARLVEKVTMVPVVNEAIEEQDQVETFRRQFGEGLFKIWPTKPLTAGEYAVVQYTEGKLSVQVWDFRLE
jgi:TPP-dependent indolepyruvate ferredoxin oxidoreductase alpha subunit